MCFCRFLARTSRGISENECMVWIRPTGLCIAWLFTRKKRTKAEWFFHMWCWHGATNAPFDLLRILDGFAQMHEVLCRGRSSAQVKFSRGRKPMPWENLSRVVTSVMVRAAKRLVNKYCGLPYKRGAAFVIVDLIGNYGDSIHPMELCHTLKIISLTICLDFERLLVSSNPCHSCLLSSRPVGNQSKRP